MMPLLREAPATIRTAGYTPVMSSAGTSMWSGAQQHRIVLSRSPSNRNAHLRVRAELRRELNGKQGATA
jgi:hypothetical protein